MNLNNFNKIKISIMTNSMHFYLIYDINNNEKHMLLKLHTLFSLIYKLWNF